MITSKLTDREKSNGELVCYISRERARAVEFIHPCGCVIYGSTHPDSIKHRTCYGKMKRLHCKDQGESYGLRDGLCANR